MRSRALIVLVAWSRLAWAQPTETPTPMTPSPTAVGSATAFDASACRKPAPSATPAGVAPPPVTWNGFDIEGQLRDPLATVRALLEPTLNRHRALTDAARDDLRRITTAFGYQLGALETRDTPAGVHLIVHLSALPMVRHVDVDVHQSITDTLLDDEIRRRMRVRVGSYLPSSASERACELYDEKRRIEEFLRDEGYIEGTVAVAEKSEGSAITLTIKVDLGPEYTTGAVRIADPEALAVNDAEIRAKFRHRICIFSVFCYGEARFKRSRHQEDIAAVVTLFHERGYPAVRVRSDFDPLTSFDRRTKRVSFTITIDQRRKLDVVFEGQDDTVSAAELREQLTFNDAASSDDVEANESARAITSFLQTRGYFDARVTWTRERFDPLDRLIFRVDQGPPRTVQGIEFAGNHALTTAQLDDVIGTHEARLSSSLFGRETAASSAQLAADVDRIAEIYRRAGYRDVRVSVHAATDPIALGSAALTAALVAADRGDAVFVRYTIEEGPPTLLTEVHVELADSGDAITTPDQRALCVQALQDLADLYRDPQLGKLGNPDRCVGIPTSLNFREADALDIRDRLKDRMFSHGRPRARVTYEPQVIGPHRVAAHYKLEDVQPLRIGKVVVRGNFRTNGSIIRQQLHLDEGSPLTKDALAEGARRLRSTGLFDAVNVALPDLDHTSEGTVNAVIEVAERYDYFAQADAEVGYSSYNGAFLKLIPSFKNLWGVGISLDVAGTIGFDLGEAFNNHLQLRQLSAESTLRIPQWLVEQFAPVAFQAELTAFHRRQDTPRFGVITTDGVTLALARTWQWQRTATRAAHAVTLGLHYDFRLRERPVDVLRPIGADDDQTQVPISTRTGSSGVTFEWEHRNDRQGTLSPLAPEAGFRLEAQFSVAHPWLFSQDTFLKASAAASKYIPLGPNLVLRADLRWDEGFPLGGAVLLPEVERFFAGGDSTVRGYNDDRLATEILQVGVPPLGNVQQIRILPAGGNIRVIGSLDAQLRIWRVLATALFVDAGMITNQWSTVTADDIRPSVGVALLRIVTPFGAFAFERALPLRPRLGDDPRGRWHISFAARAQF